MAGSVKIVCPYCRKVQREARPFCPNCRSLLPFPMAYGYSRPVEESRNTWNAGSAESTDGRSGWSSADDGAVKQRLTLVILAVLLFAVGVGGIVTMVMKNIHYGKPRNFATETMDVNFVCVYADIVSLEPVYFTQPEDGPAGDAYDEAICRCETVEGIEIWALIHRLNYPGGGYLNPYPRNSISRSRSEPMKLVGVVTTAYDVSEEIGEKLGDIYLLKVGGVQELPAQ